jgi:DMSO reductase anchor subunit
MHPAKSIILFTVASGLGFGLLAFLCMGFPAVTGWVAFLFFGVGFALAGGGLLSSTFHLGHPERALKAFSQWRTSWLSREGWLACATLGTAGLYAALLVLAGIRVLPLGWLAALLCLATVYATSMIYAQLKTVPRWNHWTTSALFMALALTGGALLSGAVVLALPLLAICFGLQFFTWKLGDSQLAESGTTLASATGLGGIGTVRAFEPPHTGGNYLTKEMFFVIARKHALKLRSIALALAFVAPFLLLLLPFTHFFVLIAILTHVAGLLVLRWLFFAEAEHVVSLYYGRT